MTDKPPTTPCARCGQQAYVGRDGIHCNCTPARSAAENHARRRAHVEAAHKARRAA